MPTFNTFIHGNLPIEVEIDQDGDFMDAKCGDVWLELDFNEIEAIMYKSEIIIQDTLSEYQRNKLEYDKMIARGE